MENPTPAKRSRLRRWLFAAAIALGTLGLAEVGLRIVEPPVYKMQQGTYPLTAISERPHVYAFRPNTQTTFRWDGDPLGSLPEGAAVTYRLNRFGLRGPPPTAAGRRVLVVGDSFVFGEGVVLEDTFVARAEPLVRKAGAPDAALVNAGVPGYGTVQEAFRLPGWLAQIRPSAVVVVYNPNDPIPLEHSMTQVRDLLFSPVVDDPREARGLRLLELWKRAGKARQSEDWYLSYYRGAQAAHWVGVKRLLGEMRDGSRAAGARFGVVLFPLLHRLSAAPLADIHDEVEAACRELDVPYLDLTAAFEGEDERDLWVHPIDHHPNGRAHELAAERLAPFVADLLQ